MITGMEAATEKPVTGPAPKGEDRDFALRLGALLLHAMSYGGAGSVVRAIEETGLSFVQMKALVTIGGAGEGETSIKHVAASLGVSLPSASRAVDGLVKKRLATRVEDSEDRRLRRVSLTAAGEGLVDEILAARLEGLERFVSELDPAERRKLDAALELLLEREELGAIYRSHGRRVSR
jgi:DNA-binding MarR family transcriptional regulator